MKKVRKAGAEVRLMKRSGRNWKWPKPEERAVYQEAEIFTLISAPKQISRRGLYSIPELQRIDYF